MNKEMEITLDNLKIALEQLPRKAIEFPHIKEEFDMQRYGCMHHRTKRSDCKTQGCLLGNMIHVFKPIKSDFYDDGTFDCGRFGNRLFPALKNLSTSKEIRPWNFLFSSYWAIFDNTFDGALARIQYFVDKKGRLGVWKYEDFANLNTLGLLLKDY